MDARQGFRIEGGGMKDARCENCQFAGRDTFSTVECRRHAPGYVVQEYQTITYKPVWPEVQKDDWCGDFQPRHVKRRLYDMIKLAEFLR